MTPPRGNTAVSVVLPVYNGAGTVAEAVTSILDQTRRDIEVIVIDDGSADDTLDILRAIRDPRLVIIAEPAHRGFSACLNRGIEQATSDVIARMDADDIAHPDRLALEYSLLSANPDVGLVATATLLVDEDGHDLGFVGVPPDHASAQFDLLFGNCIAHSSVMFRRDVLDAVGGYAEDCFPADDYDLWLRMVEVARFAFIPSPQVTRRRSPAGVSATQRLRQHDIACELSALAIERMTGTRPPARVVEGLAGLGSPLGCSDFAEAFAVVLSTYHAVSRTCRQRGIATRSLRQRLSRMALRSGLRYRNGAMCREQVAQLLVHHPIVCMHLASTRLRKISRKRPN